MGVSLERVQFKFASIIGELCSEPDILSQFAVWLDLRLAEYKLKGAISLDCSGAEPDPVWLKGLGKQKAPPRVNSQTDRRTQSHSPSAYRSPSLHRPGHSDSDISLSQAQSVPSAELAERLSPEVVVVKDEPDVYPVSLHAHENHKRSATDNVGADFRDGPKERRLSVTESLSHQSLMSVIGGFESETDGSYSRGVNSGMNNEMVTRIIGLPGELSDLNVSNMQSLPDLKADMTAQPGTCTVTNTGGSGNEYFTKNTTVVRTLVEGRSHVEPRENTQFVSGPSQAWLDVRDREVHGINKFSKRKLSNAEKQKLYREKKKLIMTDEERERAKRMSQERYRRWKARNLAKFAKKAR